MEGESVLYGMLHNDGTVWETTVQCTVEGGSKFINCQLCMICQAKGHDKLEVVMLYLATTKVTLFTFHFTQKPNFYEAYT